MEEQMQKEQQLEAEVLQQMQLQQMEQYQLLLWHQQMQEFNYKQEEVRLRDGVSMASGSGPEQEQQRSRDRFNPDNHPVYKTQLCKFYLEGKCQRGSRCTYAHGEEELTEVEDGDWRCKKCGNLNFSKRQMCRNIQCCALRPKASKDHPLP